MRNKQLKVRLLSGILSAVLAVSAAAVPVTAMAGESSPGNDLREYVSSLPELEDIRDQLDGDEIVTAEDYEVSFGSDIDLKTDFTNLKIPDKKKVAVSFYEAKNSEKKDFSTKNAGTYKAVYYAEPANMDHPAYRFDRKVIVKEQEHKNDTGATASVAMETPPSKETVKSTAAKAAATLSTANAAKASSGSSTDSAEDNNEESGDEAEEGDDDASGAAGSSGEIITESSAGETVSTEKTDAAAGSTEKEASSTIEKNLETQSSEAERKGATGSSAAPADTSDSGSADEASASTTVNTASTGETAVVSAEVPEENDPYGGEDGWTTAGIIKWATEEEQISLAEMGVGETVTFEVPKKKMALKAASTGTMKVEITKGERYHFNDYDLGHFWTHPYYVKYGNITATAYCIEPSKSAPDSGTYTITKMKDSKTLAKVCYYGTKYSGDEGFFAENHPDFPAPERFIITHLAAGYANEGEDAFRGTSDKGKKLAMEMYNYCQSMPDIPDVDMLWQ